MTWNDALGILYNILEESVYEVGYVLQESGTGTGADLYVEKEDGNLYFEMDVTMRTLKSTSEAELKKRCDGVAYELIKMAKQEDSVDVLRDIVNVMQSTGHKIILVAVAEDSKGETYVKDASITAADLKRIAKNKFRLNI